MTITDAAWTPAVIVLAIECNCGHRLLHPASYSLCCCPSCGRVEMWHAVQPVAFSGLFSAPVMRREGRA